MILFSVPIFVLKKDPFLPDVFSVSYRNTEYRQPDGFCSCISSTCPFMKVLHCSVAEKTNILLQRSFFMTYNISGRKQNLTLQRCNCTPYLKRDIDIPANCTIISEKTFQNRSMIQSVSFPYGLKQIGSNAFSGCSRLKHLLLPESLCQIGRKHFPTVPLYPLSISLNIFPQFQRACSATPTNYQKLFFPMKAGCLKSRQTPFQNALH